MGDFRFFFDHAAVLHALLLAAGLVCLIMVLGGLACLATRLLERDCRRDVWYDEEGRRHDRPHH